MSRFRQLVFFSIVITGISGCVSVNIGPKKPGRAENVRAVPPGAEFRAVSDTAADQAWQSSRTGNTISYLSECPETTMSLESLTNESLAVLREREVLDQQTKFFNARGALETVATGTLDGIAMKMSAMVFKRNGCSYLITYAARTPNYDEEVAIYRRFLEGFQAP